mgnify:CR=1 FL=1
MAISRMQQPRQLYGLGSLVKSIGKGVKKLVKSPVGKLAILGLGGAGLMGRGPLAGILGGAFGGKTLPPSMGFKSTGFLGNLLGKVPGGGYTVGAIGSILAASGMSPEEIEETKQNPDAVKVYLKDYYKKLNPNAKDDEVEQFVTVNMSEYATGGRVGLSDGTPMKMASMDDDYEQEFMKIVGEFMEKGFSQQEAIEAAKDKLERKSIAIGGRVGLAQGDIARAAGIMGNLPVRQNKAGVTELDLRETGGFIPPVGIKEKADDVPAMLSNNEFVFTADAVRAAGGGSVNKGAQILYDKMKQLESKVG